MEGKDHLKLSRIDSNSTEVSILGLTSGIGDASSHPLSSSRLVYQSCF